MSFWAPILSVRKTTEALKDISPHTLLNGISHIPVPKRISVRRNEASTIGLDGPVMVHPWGLGRNPVSPKHMITLYLKKTRVLITKMGGMVMSRQLRLSVCDPQKVENHWLVLRQLPKVRYIIRVKLCLSIRVLTHV